MDEKALKHKGGRTYLPRLKKRLYKGLNLEDGKDKELYKEYSPEMRDEAFRKFLERVLRIPIHANGYDVCVMADADGLCIF